MRNNKLLLRSALILLGAGALLVLDACSSVPTTDEGMAREQAKAVPEARSTLKTMMASDPSIERILESATGYVVFPKVTSGALIIGGEGGDGVVFRGNDPWGVARLAKGSIGAQVGGEIYSELIVLLTESAFESFTAGEFKFAAGMKAVAIKSGAATAAPVSDGMITLTMTRGGLIASVAIGGQKFSCQPFDSN